MDHSERHVSDIETRLLAMEMVLAEFCPWVSDEVFELAALAISLGIEREASADRRQARPYAVELLVNGRWRASLAGQRPAPDAARLVDDAAACGPV